MACKFLLLAVLIILISAGCSNHIRKTGDSTYSSTYKSFRNEDDARSQARFKAALECTGFGKRMTVINEKKFIKRGFVHVIEFECVD